ncbi:MAG: AAA family ATPase [Sphaerochaetaceae bacterium]|nr:AAA family ATPase [Sphaerochaetaceae bacterium]
MHKIDWIRIKNFRSCSDVKVSLEAFSPIVGYNNAGKSNILKAIKWLLRPTGLQEIDFNDKNEKITVTAKISGISIDLLDNIGETHKTNIEPFIIEECLYVRVEQRSPGGAKGLRKLYVSLGGESEDDEEWEWSPNPNGIQEALNNIFPEPIYVQSMDNATDDVSKFKTTSTIGKLLQILSKKIEEEQHELIDAFETISKKLNFDGEQRLDHLSEFDEIASQRVQDFFPGLELTIHIPTPTLSKLFTDGTVKIKENGREAADVDSLGHGAQRSIQMALIRLLAEVQTDISEGQTTLLIIDEPELYLHPQAIELIRDALKTLSTLNYQIVFSTHSSLLVRQEDVPYTSIVRKNENTFVIERISEAICSVIEGNLNQARILFEIENMNQILFADRVLIAEGKTERAVLPFLFDSFNRSLTNKKTALVISEGCSGIHKMGSILDKIGIPYKALVDLDHVFTTAVNANLIDEDDTDLVEAIRLLGESATRNGFDLEGNLPKSTNGRKAYIAYELFADEDEAKIVITNLHTKMKEKNYWLWEKGAIEQHLSLESKRTGDWIAFNLNIESNNPQDVLEDFDSVNSMTEWATT